jgi:hypothetical protein
MKSTALWVVTPCNSVTAQRFGVTYRRHLQGRTVSQADVKLLTDACGGREEGMDKRVRDENRHIYRAWHQFRTYWPAEYLCSVQLN